MPFLSFDAVYVGSPIIKILFYINSLTSTSFQLPYGTGVGLPTCHPTAPEQLYIISQPHANLKAVVLVDMH